MSGDRRALPDVLWIGGAPCVGKSTLARLLAGTYDLRLYDLDHRDRHRAWPAGAFADWLALSMDERWLLPSPAEMAERDVRNWGRRFAFAAEELGTLRGARTIVVEGPTALPWSVARLAASPRHAIFLVPTPEWRRRVLDRRERAGRGHAFVAATSDPDRARQNVAERDAILAERIVASCTALGLRCERVDGSRDLDAMLALLVEHFRPHLPAGYNV